MPFFVQGMISAYREHDVVQKSLEWMELMVFLVMGIKGIVPPYKAH